MFYSPCPSHAWTYITDWRRTSMWHLCNAFYVFVVSIVVFGDFPEFTVLPFGHNTFIIIIFFTEITQWDNYTVFMYWSCWGYVTLITEENPGRILSALTSNSNPIYYHLEDFNKNSFSQWNSLIGLLGSMDNKPRQLSIRRVRFLKLLLALFWVTFNRVLILFFTLHKKVLQFERRELLDNNAQ